ncbi:FAD-binding oxidoreductase [Croceicoccus mobilis]|uniref:D-2-hydroxyacid dehydrogenase n=1 Tax=Croceicoccus mobilis TaxID=1703339 RepID=A0A916YWK6_9SPHN|nr:FAD-binding oxidoreductase [Croceicoccus mobilis]GGD63179.1 D-2-hydroxyacid dehydrogenase [Croceicoccus mobilis]
MTDTHAKPEIANADPVLEKALAILGPRGLVTDADTIEPWLTDWRGRYHGAARALAQPETVEELAQLIKLCGESGVPIVPQGGNSGMVGGATPDQSGDAILLSTRRFQGIEIDEQTMTARCGAGVILQVLHEAAEDVGLRFPLSLGGKGSATVGGLIATNAGGTQVLRHGTMRALVEGIEVVLPNGDVLDLTSPLKKDNRGFDLKQLWIGSEGTLGIVTSAVLQLVPAIAERRVVWAGLPDIFTARKLLLHCQRAMPDALEGFEVMPGICIEQVLKYVPNAQSPLEGEHGWHVLLEFDAAKDAADGFGEAVEQVLADAFEAGLIEDAVIAANEGQAAQFWELRENISPAEKQRGPAMQHDISVAVASMPEVLSKAEKEIPELFPGTMVMGFGHLGDGNIHLHVCEPGAPDKAAWEASTGKAVSRWVYEMVTAAGGSISAEHGIGQDKRDILLETHDPAAIRAMRAVKAALDPQGLLNPGKLV